MLFKKRFLLAFPKNNFLYSLYDLYRTIGIIVSVFANGQGDQSSISGQVMLKTQNIVLAVSLFNTQHHKVWIKGIVE